MHNVEFLYMFVIVKTSVNTHILYLDAHKLKHSNPHHDLFIRIGYQLRLLR
jgi:hypothetical protein